MPSPTRTVLVVEDDHLLLLNARLLLENAGYEVLVADDATAALALLDTHEHIAAVFTDIVMPGVMDGLALADEVHRRRPDVPIYVTSGRVDRASELPPSATFLAKPYTAATVLRLLAA